MDIRMGTEADAPGVRAVYAPLVESTAVSFELVVPTVDETARRMTERQPLHPWLVGDSEGCVVGYAYAGRFSARAAYDWSVETSVYVAEAARGRRVGTALYTALFAVLSAQGYCQALAGVTLPNAASVALHEGVGFTPVGVYRAVGWKFGRWHDVGWWQRSVAGADGPPSGPPVPFTELPAATLGAALEAGRAVLG